MRPVRCQEFGIVVKLTPRDGPTGITHGCADMLNQQAWAFLTKNGFPP